MPINDVLPSRSSPFTSDTSFKQSCEAILKKSKRLDARTLNSILAHDDPNKPMIDDDKHIYIWYLAIGSMINPISLYLRDITPVMSYPAKCLDHRLVFRDHCGMADIQSCHGEEFDGVVHLIPAEQMDRLDQVEHMYQRITVNTVDYQQRSHLVYVYKMTLIGHEERPIGIPSERYLDIIVKGCEYFGVRSSYINRLKHEQLVIPRKLPSAYQTITNVPGHIYYTNEDLAKHDGKDPMSPLWISVNGKILEYTGLPPDDHCKYDNEKRFYEFVLSYFDGREVERAISRIWYEPMYKLLLNDNDDIPNEQCAFAEDICVSWGLNCCGGTNESYWKPIGRLLQTSRSPKLD